MSQRFWPLGSGRRVTSGFGPRDGGFHAGVDFGRDGGSAGMPVYACEAGTVRYCGAAQGYGGPDPAGWLVIESASRTWELGHIRRLDHVNVGSTVRAGQQVAIINPDTRTNGGTPDKPIAPHLHVSMMDGRYNPNAKIDPLPVLRGATEPEAISMTAPKPDYNEYWVQSRNSQSRNGTPPVMFLIHTQEGDGNADSLARYLCGPNGVSYHYTISEDYNDHGVTVCDVVDTDFASWSVLDYNNRSINLCFAGSRAGWSRDQWMRQQRAIDVAAYLAVEDCKKYGFSSVVVPPPYRGTPGISDHAYVTHMGIGTHTDVGPNFPWDHFASRVDLYAGRVKPPAPQPPPPVQPPTPVPPPPPPDPLVRLDRLEARVARLEADYARMSR